MLVWLASVVASSGWKGANLGHRTNAVLGILTKPVEFFSRYDVNWFSAHFHSLEMLWQEQTVLIKKKILVTSQLFQVSTKIYGAADIWGHVNYGNTSPFHKLTPHFKAVVIGQMVNFWALSWVCRSLNRAGCHFSLFYQLLITKS